MANLKSQILIQMQNFYSWDIKRYHNLKLFRWDTDQLENFKPHEIEMHLIQPERIWRFEGVENEVADYHILWPNFFYSIFKLIDSKGQHNVLFTWHGFCDQVQQIVNWSAACHVQSR